MGALDVLADWPVPTAAAAVVSTAGVLADWGDTRRRFALASVTKPLVARAAQVAIHHDRRLAGQRCHLRQRQRRGRLALARG